MIFYRNLFTVIEDIKTFLYIAEPGSAGLSKVNNETEKFLSSPLSIVKHKIFDTRSKQVLFEYYITKVLGIKVKIEIPVTKIAMFYHALLGWEYNEINNTVVYKLLKKLPIYKLTKNYSIKTCFG